MVVNELPLNDWLLLSEASAETEREKMWKAKQKEPERGQPLNSPPAGVTKTWQGLWVQNGK